MSQLGISPSADVAAFGRGEDRELRKLRRENSVLRNLWGMLIGVKDISAEYLMYLLMMIILSPFLAFGGASLLETLGIVIPVALTIAVSVICPLGMLGLFMSVNVNKSMAAKRKAVASTLRSAERLDRKARPVLTTDHVLVREKLDELFMRGPADMSQDDLVSNADSIFALMLEDFGASDEVLRIVDERGMYTVDEVRAVMHEMQQSPKPLQDGAL